MAEKKREVGDRAAPWKPGQSGNPTGRPKGSRSAISSKYVLDLYNHWNTYGRQAIHKLYKEDVAAYVRAVGALVPKEHKVEISVDQELAGMNGDEIEAYLFQQLVDNARERGVPEEELEEEASRALRLFAPSKRALVIDGETEGESPEE